VKPPEPDFLRALALIRMLQRSDAVGMRIQIDEKKRESALLLFQTKDVSAESIEQGRELRRLLRLDPEATRFKLVFGATSSNNRELALQTRSILHLMQAMAAQIDVPPKHLAE